jgi:hypothetical protein
MTLPSANTGAWFTVQLGDGSFVTGLDETDFDTYAVYLGGGVLTSWSSSPTVLEHPSLPGRYCFAYTNAPACPSWRFDAVPKNSLHKINPEYWSSDQSRNDIDSAVGALSRTVVADTISRLIGSRVNRTKGAYFYDEWDIPFRQGSVPLPLNGYTDLVLRVNTMDKSTKILEAINGVGGWVITGDSAGILHITWPESTGTGVADIYGWLPAGKDFAPALKWQVDGLFGGVSGHRVPIIRSSDLTLFRSEEVIP